MAPSILLIFCAIVWILVATSILRWHPFVVLLLAALGLGITSGIPLADLAGVIKGGFGGLLESIGLLIIFGTMIGIILEASGATVAIAEHLLKAFKRLPSNIVMSHVGFMVSIPVFCDAAFIVLSSLNKTIAEQSRASRKALTVALSTGLLAPHVLVPPTPGPLAAAATLQMDNILLLFLVGALLSWVVVMIGSLFSLVLFRGVHSSQSKTISQGEEDQPNETKNLQNELSVDNQHAHIPSFWLSILPILLPIVLMTLRPLSGWIDPAEMGWLHSLIGFVSDPTIALMVGVLVGLPLLSSAPSLQFHESITKTIQQAAPILLITAMGGALGAVIQQMNLSESLQSLTFSPQLGLLLPFVIAAVLKTAQGSSTVAIITTASIIFPLLPVLGYESDLEKVWMILSIGVGSMTVSHANDSYFWVVSQFGGLSVEEAYKSHTIATLLQGIGGFLALSVFVVLWSLIA